MAQTALSAAKAAFTDSVTMAMYVSCRVAQATTWAGATEAAQGEAEWAAELAQEAKAHADKATDGAEFEMAQFYAEMAQVAAEKAKAAAAATKRAAAAA